MAALLQSRNFAQREDLARPASFNIMSLQQFV
jgi:hypothetical protein